MKTTQNEITNLKIGFVAPSQLNPRKHIDESAIVELSKSILEKGLIQPITVRPMDSGYEIVCGERRYRATVLAGLKTIAAIVRELSDDEAMDLMITENLQRKDVEPLDEAEAFHNLITHRKYTVPDLAQRFGKSLGYVSHRLKLNDLIEPFRELLRTDVIGLGHANEICKLNTEDQELYYNEDFKQRASWWKLPTVANLKKDIQRIFLKSLSEAKFNPEDETLDPVMGSCVSCPNNTASNFALFPDAPESGLCMKIKCYENKALISFSRELERVTTEEPQILLVKPSYGYADDQAILNDLKKRGLTVHEDDSTLEVIEPPDEPDRDDFMDDEEGEQIYNEEVEDYKKELAEFEKNISDPNTRKAFIVAGSNKGKIVPIILKSEKSKPGKTDSLEDAEAAAIRLQIIELESKDKRNVELATEKIFNSVVELFRNEKYVDNHSTGLTYSEWLGFLLSIIPSSPEHELKKQLKLTDSWIDGEKKYKIAKKIVGDSESAIIPETTSIQRLVFREKIFSELRQIGRVKALIDICRDFYPEALKTIEDEQNAIVLKRRTGINQKIKELKEKLEALQPEKPKKSAKGKKK